MMKERFSKKRIHVVDNTKEASTLDDIHTNTIKKYTELNNHIYTLNDELSNLEMIYSNIDMYIKNNNTESNITNIQMMWTSNVQIKDKIIQIKEELQNLENTNEINYYEKTGNILFNYYNIVDNNIKTNSTNHVKTKKFTILDALTKSNKDDSSNNQNNPDNSDTPDNQNNSDGPASNNNCANDKASLVNEYLSITDNKYINHVNGEFVDTMCPTCKKTELTNMQFDALSICMNCGHQDVLLAEQNRPIMIHDKKDNMHYSYKRINHFREWCNQVQGKESTEIPNEIFEKILEELKKEKITDTTKLTPKYMRTILKKIRTHKYYEHTAYIINRINGIPPPHFSPDLEQKLANMFMQTQPLFIKHAPSNRLNFISYSYILHKFFLILDMKEYLPLFPLLKSRQKIAQNEETMKKICAEIGWPWIPSI